MDCYRPGNHRRSYTLIAIGFVLSLLVGIAWGANTFNSEQVFNAGLRVPSWSSIKADSISESSSGGGVTIDGVKMQDGSTYVTADVGTVGTSVTAVEGGSGAVHKTVLTISSLALTVTDAAAAGAHSSSKLYTFPAGYIQILAATGSITGTCGTTGLTATATNEIGVGSVTAAVDNAALSSTEEDILTGNASDLVASAEAYTATKGALVPLDGTTTAEDVWLNFVFAADDASDNDTCTMNGTVTLVWANAGDI